MRKPGFNQFKEFKKIFNRVNEKNDLKQQIIPYFISSHPGSTEEDMAELAVETKKLDFKLEQVQDFTPTPMTVSTEIYYTGIHPYTLEKVYTARSKDEKLRQRQFFFWYKPEERSNIANALRRIKRPDLLNALYPDYGNMRDSGNNRKPQRSDSERNLSSHRRPDPFRPGKSEASRRQERDKFQKKK